MGDIGRHDDQTASRGDYGLAADADFGLARQDLNKGVEGGSMFGQGLLGGKGEKGQGADRRSGSECG